LHFIGGLMIMYLVVFQFIGRYFKWPLIHKFIGYLICSLDIITALGGIIFIYRQGTIGGVDMDISFFIYGELMICFAFRVIYLAQKRKFKKHQHWTIRLFML